jgi:zinc-ribbon domain
VSGDMVYCVECGQAVAPSASFCKACGARQHPEGGDPPATAVAASAVQTPPAAGAGAGAAPVATAAPPSSGRPQGQTPEWQRSLSSSLRLSRDEWIVAGCALFLFIDLLALPWFEISAYGFGVSFTATQSPDGWLCVLAVLGCVALVADLLVDRMSPQAALPTIGGSRAMVRIALAAVIAGLVGLKFLLNVHFSIFGAGFYIGIILTATLVVFTVLAQRAEHQ